MEIRKDLVNRYPWLPSLKKYYSEFESLNPVEFISDIFSKKNGEEIYQRVLQIVENAFNNNETIPNYKTDELNVYLYLILKIILYSLNDKVISNRVANLYSKINYDFLLNENESNLYNICDDLKLNFQYKTDPWIYKKNTTKHQVEVVSTHFRIYFADYLDLAVHLRDSNRKLVNNALSDGYVYLREKGLARLLQEHVRYKLLLQDERDEPNLNIFKNELLKIDEFKDLYNEITNRWELKKEDLNYFSEIKFDKNVDLFNYFPPCIKELLKKMEEGQNLIHIERLYLVFFLNSFEYPEDFLLKLFSKSPDFDSEKALYQIQFAKKKKYTPHSCSTLKSLNLCLASQYKDKLCLEGYYSKTHQEQRKIRHPLFYVQLKQYRLYKKDKSREEPQQKIEQKSEQTSQEETKDNV